MIITGFSFLLQQRILLKSGKMNAKWLPNKIDSFTAASVPYVPSAGKKTWEQNARRYFTRDYKPSRTQEMWGVLKESKQGVGWWCTCMGRSQVFASSALCASWTSPAKRFAARRLSSFDSCVSFLTITYCSDILLLKQQCSSFKAR